jgi:TolA-binding protein
MLAEVPPDFRPAREWHEALENNPKDALALAGMGRFFVKAGSSRFANQFYSAALKSDSCDAKLRSSLTLATGMNHLILADWNTARKVLRQFLKDYPDAPGRDQALFGLVLADYRQGKRSGAAKTLSELERDYPSSESTVSASKLLRSGH